MSTVNKSSEKSIRRRDKTYYPNIISHRESICPSTIDGDINTELLKLSKKKLGNKCHKEGYIDTDSIKLIERSIGKINTSHFNGAVIYDLKLEVKTCNPIEGDILNCKVIGVNKMGIMCQNYPLLIALSKIHHNEDLERFQSVKKGDNIKVEVICSKFELNDKEINVIGKLYELNPN
tara:strand:- start:70 stop:600 length:531 start_codon:yes stop_codon:yes gene_type:complete